MRSLFILLLVMNICYLIWGVAFSEKNDYSEQVVQLQSQQTLTLIGELNNLAATVETKELAKINAKNSTAKSIDKNLPPSMAPAKTCYSLGPILDEKDSKKLEKKLKLSGFNPKHKAITDKEPKSYWVYFPAEKSLADAKAVVNQLRDAKVDDYFIVRKGEFNNAISMGLYNSYGRAKIRIKKLKKLGFNPKVQTRYKSVTRHWLDFQETDTQRLNTSIWETIQKDNPLQKLARPCVPLASNSDKKKQS